MPVAHSKSIQDWCPLVQSWYPLVRSTDLAPGKSIGLDVMGQPVVVFRSLTNKTGVLRRHCCHMGGDLSRGCVTQSGIRCPIHGWEFAVNGARLFASGRDGKATNTQQPSLPCIERHGIIFAFFGRTVLFDLPAPAEPVFCSQVKVRDFDARYDVPTIFGFDSEHFATVHNRSIDSLELYSLGPQHLGTRIHAAVKGKNLGDRLMRAIGLDSIATDIDFWAANLMLGRHKRTDTYAFLASLPLAENRMRMFVTVMQKRPTGGTLRQCLGRFRFRCMRPVVMGFVAQDEQALEGVRFDAEQSLLSDNPGVRRWLEHYRHLPKFLPTQLFDAD